MLLPGEAMPTCHQYTLKEPRQDYDLIEKLITFLRAKSRTSKC